MTYKIYLDPKGSGAQCVVRDELTSIPLDMGNRDCRRFVWDWKNGAPVTRGNGAHFAFTHTRLLALGLTDLLSAPGI